MWELYFYVTPVGLRRLSVFSLIKSHCTAFSHTKKQLSAAEQDLNVHKPLNCFHSQRSAKSHRLWCPSQMWGQYKPKRYMMHRKLGFFYNFFIWTRLRFSLQVRVLTRAQYVSGGSPQVMFGGSRVTFRYWVMSAASGWQAM